MRPPCVCAITCDEYPADPLVRRTSEAAAREGCEYHVICASARGQVRNEEINGVQVHRVQARRVSGKPLPVMLFSWSVLTLLASLQAARLHQARRFDVVHVHNMPDFLVLAALIPKLRGAKVILHVQDVSPELMAVKSSGLWRRFTVALARWQERLSTKFADHVLTVGWPFEELLLKRGVSKSKLSSLLNSADPNLFPPEKRTAPFAGEATAQRPLAMMYHGTIAERSGLDTAILALAKACTTAPHLRLCIKGRGEGVPELKRLAQRLGVEDRVSFLSFSPPDEMADFLEQGDIGIIPYPCNGFSELLLPTKAYEFALMRRPMVVSDTPAMRSMFRAQSLMLCEPGDADSFAAAIVELYRDPQKRRELTRNAEEDYAPYHWEAMAKSYNQLLVLLTAEARR